jgi:hypothetical protein
MHLGQRTIGPALTLAVRLTIQSLGGSHPIGLAIRLQPVHFLKASDKSDYAVRLARREFKMLSRYMCRRSCTTGSPAGYTWLGRTLSLDGGCLSIPSEELLALLELREGPLSLLGVCWSISSAVLLCSFELGAFQVVLPAYFNDSTQNRISYPWMMHSFSRYFLGSIQPARFGPSGTLGRIGHKNSCKNSEAQPEEL